MGSPDGSSSEEPDPNLSIHAAAALSESLI